MQVFVEMQNTYSSAQLQDYGRRLAARVCDAHFAAQPVGTTLDGPAVLKLTPVRQLNLFVVQQLLAQWTQEMANLRSPYFDYEDPAVRQALTQLMNLLSRRIRLTRPTYEPLLAQAAADTLRAALDPAATFADKLVPASQPAVTPAQLRDALRYMEINKPLYQSFIDALPADIAQERDYLLNRFRLHLDAHYKERQPAEQLLQELSALLPVQEADLREAKAAAPAATPAASAAPAAAPAVSSPAAAPEAAAPAPAPVAEPAVVAPEAAAAPPAPAPSPAATPAPEPVAPKPEAKPERVPLAASMAPVSTLNDKFASSRSSSSLHEKLAPQPASTLAETQPKVDSLRNAISINQRFSFINELFNGENMEYHAAIEHLDSLPSADAARRYVNDDLTKRYQWVRKEEHVNKLLRLIDRKFA